MQMGRTESDQSLLDNSKELASLQILMLEDAKLFRVILACTQRGMRGSILPLLTAGPSLHDANVKWRTDSIST